MRFSRRHLLLTIGGAGLSVSTGCASSRNGSSAQAPVTAPNITFSQWRDEDPFYLFFPNDRLEVQVPSAPELNRPVIVGQDGRISLPLIGQVMAAYKSVPELTAEITELYRPHLRHPEAQLFPAETSNTRVLVGGEVRAPGWVEAPGVFDALSAVLAAGGFTPSAKPEEVVLIRRSIDGQIMRRFIDLESQLKGRGGPMVALRRYDIVYVPRSNIANVALWVDQHINSVIPSGIMNYLTYRVF
ncbi:polysaccharide biosynthesis/export family protein [Asticcacaulis tiandongensis]|uniref:polysaccharide biosynthesis/export family protein n=1 Tax=Asticcacaulis tiandongensis TaxID=2565365 RepID=UPI00112EB3A4|nr:polysaccharide biosynthesis/export family protein [Asticcacaulis tiandongensis]